MNEKSGKNKTPTTINKYDFIFGTSFFLIQFYSNLHFSNILFKLKNIYIFN